MSPSVKERHFIGAEINAELFDYSYFLQTDTVFVVQFLKVRR